MLVGQVVGETGDGLSLNSDHQTTASVLWVEFMATGLNKVPF